jgi:putative acetyltransferase
MPPHTTIRPEGPNDVAAIAEVTREAFQSHPHSVQTEHFIIAALRSSNVLSISLVAEVDGRVAGHIAFSPVKISDGSQDWYGLGPLAVKPEFQGQGIGQALVHAGLAALRALGAEGCVLAGSPKFYGRFGFRSREDLVLEGLPQEYVLAFPFGEKSARGQVTYHEAFSAQG